jgi:hypothetical protein
MTGREYPFVEDNIIHFWIPSYLGVTFMHWLLPKWVDKEPTHVFLKHGLIALFDYSGNDYHKATVRYFDEDRFISLADLAVDTSINTNTERLQSGEAASFVAFVLAAYGPKRLEMMYRSDEPFDELVQDSLGISIDSLQGSWIDFAISMVPPETREEWLSPDTTE